MSNNATAHENKLRQDLQSVLGQLFELHVQGVEAHAHFTGTRFTGMQHQLGAVVEAAREASDAIAGALHEWDDGDSRQLVIKEVPPAVQGLRPGESCTTAAVSMITHRISLVLSTIRCVLRDPRDLHPLTAELLCTISEAVHQLALSLISEARSVNSQTWSADRRSEL